jgi:SAM-dependent methyltransferase
MWMGLLYSGWDWEDEMAESLFGADELREQVKQWYRDIAADPHGNHHCHTGRPLAILLGYPLDLVDALPDQAVESFAGVGNPFLLNPLRPGQRVVDVGSGAGFDSFVAERMVGAKGKVIGIDMTDGMLAKARQTARQLGVDDWVEFREGFAEAMPIQNGWADVVISNGVINLCPDKQAVLAEILRVLRPGGMLQFAEVAIGRPLPESAMHNICINGPLPPEGWVQLLKHAGFVSVRVGNPVDIFAGARAESEAHALDLQGYPFFAVSSRGGNV